MARRPGARRRQRARRVCRDVGRRGVAQRLLHRPAVAAVFNSRKRAPRRATAFAARSRQR
eukprot:56208-Lingulodinium_polyedra.AAC.1